MRYVTSVERIGIKKGLQQGLQQGEIRVLRRLLTRGASANCRPGRKPGYRKRLRSSWNCGASACWRPAVWRRCSNPIRNIEGCERGAMIGSRERAANRCTVVPDRRMV
jgi:hypothetical protein